MLHRNGADKVLLPYEITLLSNKHRLVFMRMPVLLPYEITLLSNLITLSLNFVKFYYLMKLHYSQTRLPQTTLASGFTTL